MGGKKHKYERITIPVSYGRDPPPDIHRIIDLIANKELSAWEFVKAYKFKRDRLTGLSRPRMIKFRRPIHGKLKTTICDYMAVAVADDKNQPDLDGGWEKVAVIEYDYFDKPRTILFRRPKRK